MISNYKQLGFNSKYPYEVEVWSPNDKDIPEWMTDRCKVRNITLDGEIILDTRRTSSGNIEYIKIGTNSSLLIVSPNDSICFDQITGKLFSLTPDQLNILYRKA